MSCNLDMVHKLCFRFFWFITCFLVYHIQYGCNIKPIPVNHQLCLSCFSFFFLGDDLGVTIEKAISGETMEALIQQPGGCAEQNMAAVTMPVIAVHYLDKTMQWDKVGVEQRARAIQFINKGK